MIGPAWIPCPLIQSAAAGVGGSGPWGEHGCPHCDCGRGKGCPPSSGCPWAPSTRAGDCVVNAQKYKQSYPCAPHAVPMAATPFALPNVLLGPASSTRCGQSFTRRARGQALGKGNRQTGSSSRGWWTDSKQGTQPWSRGRCAPVRMASPRTLSLASLDLGFTAKWSPLL